MSPMDIVSPATNAVLARCASRIVMAAMHLTLPASIAAWSRFSGGVRISPQNTGVSGGCATVSCQSIQLLARARERGSAGSRLPAPDFAARERPLAVGFRREVGHDALRFPQEEAVLFGRRHQAVGVHGEIGGFLVLAEGAADVDA